MGDREPLTGGSYVKRTAASGGGRLGISGRARVGARRIAFLPGVPPLDLPRRPPGLADHISVELEEEDLLAAEIVAEARPKSLRLFDQIPMQAGDLAVQAKIVRPMLSNKRVVFMGDNDGTSLLLGIMGAFGAEAPSHMLLLDFDRRILAQARSLARQHGFADLLDTRAYNAFDPVPDDLFGQYDVFYTNPPYGSANAGGSARLFITRGVELCHSRGGACGCVILPDDNEQPWARPAMRATQTFILARGWEILEKINALHRYHLPSNPGLMSGMLWVSDVEAGRGVTPAPYAGRRVPFEEIEHFYGTKAKPPYPRYVREDGGYDEWTEGQAPIEDSIA